MKNVKTYGYHYKVNEKKKVITCIYFSNDGYWVGMAKCDDIDTFDVDKGKELARKRALLAAKKERVSRLKTEYDNNYREFVEYSQQKLTKADVKIRHLEEGIQDLKNEIRGF